MTPEQARTAWVAALRSGKYSQTKGHLRDDDGFCCLGVACEVAVIEGVIDTYEWSDPSLPDEVMHWLGLAWTDGDFKDGEYVPFAREDDWDVPSGRASSLVTLNDTAKWNFDKIADVIEAEKLANVAEEEEADG